MLSLLARALRFRGAGALPPTNLPARGRASEHWGAQRFAAPPKAVHRPASGRVRRPGRRLNALPHIARAMRLLTVVDRWPTFARF